MCLNAGVADQTPNKDNITAVLNAVGATIDADSLNLLLKQVEGKEIGELVQAGRAKLQTVSFSGSGAGAGAGSTAGPGAAKQEAAAAELESEEEEEEDMGFSLFD